MMSSMVHSFISDYTPISLLRRSRCVLLLWLYSWGRTVCCCWYTLNSLMSKNLFIFSRFTLSYSLSIFIFFLWLSPKNTSVNESMQSFSLFVFLAFDNAWSLRFWRCSDTDAIWFATIVLYSLRKLSLTYSIFFYSENIITDSLRLSSNGFVINCVCSFWFWEFMYLSNWLTKSTANRNRMATPAMSRWAILYVWIILLFESNLYPRKVIRTQIAT